MSCRVTGTATNPRRIRYLPTSCARYPQPYEHFLLITPTAETYRTRCRRVLSKIDPGGVRNFRLGGCPSADLKAVLSSAERARRATLDAGFCLRQEIGMDGFWASTGIPIIAYVCGLGYAIYRSVQPKHGRFPVGSRVIWVLCCCVVILGTLATVWSVKSTPDAPALTSMGISLVTFGIAWAIGGALLHVVSIAFSYLARRSRSVSS